MSELPLLIFDGDCAFCTTCANFARDRLGDRAGVAAWQTLDLTSFRLVESDVTSAAYWIDADRRAYRGHRAVAQAATAMGGVYRLLGMLIEFAPLRPIAAGVYRLIANNRHAMPGATDACRVDLGPSASEKSGIK